MLRLIVLVLVVGGAVLPASALAHNASVNAPAGHRVDHPMVVNFGRHAVGESSEREVTFVNNSSETIQLGPVGINALNGGGVAFGTTDPAEGACFVDTEVVELQPGESCSVLVNFTPLSPRKYRAELSIVIGTSETIRVKLMGSGADA